MKQIDQPTPEPQFKPLDQAAFNTIAGAFARLQQLSDKKIATGADDNTQAEREQLITYLAGQMMEHIAEFLGAWQLAHFEYLPLLRNIRAVATRAGYGPTPQAETSAKPQRLDNN